MRKPKKQLTMHEKWDHASKEKDNGLHFHEGEGKPIPMIGFSDQEIKEILGEDGYQKYREQLDEIEEI